MKIKEKSSLFHNALILGIVVLCFLNLNAQQDRDSIVFYENLISQPLENDHLALTYNYFQDKNNAARKRNDTIAMIYNSFQLSRIEYKVGQYYDSENSAVGALKLIDQIEPSEYSNQIKKNIINQLGILYREKTDFSKANDLYSEALIIAENARDSAMLFNNISNTYKDSDAFQEAYLIMQKAVTLIPRLKDSLSIALIMDNYGYLQYRLDDNRALNTMQEALRIRMLSDNKNAAYPSFKNLALFYKNSDPNKAQAYAKQAYDIAKTINSPAYIVDALKHRITVGQDSILLEYVAIKDSLESSRQSKANKFALLKYDVNKKEHALRESELRTQIETSKKQNYQLIAVFIGVLSVFLYLLLNYRHKRKQLQHVYNTETRISKKIHDEVANDLYRVMTKIQGDEVKNNDLLDDIDVIYNKTRDISKAGNSIDFDAEFKDSLSDLLLIYRSDDTQVITRGLNSINWNDVSNIRKTAIYRVLQELMTNMRKHSQATIASISFEESKNLLLIKYSDNGVGTTIKKHNGLQNVENRIKALKGTVTFDSRVQKGFKATIRV